MNLSDQDQSTVLELASAAADGRLEGDSLARLEQLLEHSEEARRLYVRFMTLSAGLVEIVQDGRRAADVEQQLRAAALLGPLPATAPAPSPLRVWKWIAMAAAACLVIAGALLALHASHAPQAAHSEVAVLGETLDPVWDNANYADGENLAPGVLNLKSGFARIQFFNGAIVALQGPAEFDIISAHEGYCRRGKLVAKVPPEARDFSLGSPLLTVADATGWYGVELTTSATGIPSAVVHVFQGEASVARAGAQGDNTTLVSLKQNEALSLADGVEQRLEADAQDFADWDFVQRSDRSYFPRAHEHPNWIENIYTLIQADARRRVELEPQLERVLDAFRAVKGDPMANDDPVWRAWADFWPTFGNVNSTDDELAACLESVREAKNAARKNLRAAQESLRSQLTPHEEAILLLAGWIE